MYFVMNNNKIEKAHDWHLCKVDVEAKKRLYLL